MVMSRFICKLYEAGFHGAQDYPGRMWFNKYADGKGMMVGVATGGETNIVLDAIDDNTKEEFDKEYTSYKGAWGAIKRYYGLSD